MTVLYQNYDVHGSAELGGGGGEAQHYISD